MEKNNTQEIKVLKRKNKLYKLQFFLLFLVAILYLTGSFFYFTADSHELWLRSIIGFFIICSSAVLCIPLFIIDIFLLSSKNGGQISVKQYKNVAWSGILLSVITVTTFLFIIIKES